MLPDFITYPAPIARLMAEGGPQRLIDDLEAGQTYHDIASRFGMTRGALKRFVATLHPDLIAAIHTADQNGVTAMVEESKAIADRTAEEMRQLTKPVFNDKEFYCDVVDAQAILAAEKERIRVRQWMAERKDKEAWGGKANTEVTLNLGNIFLDVLRKRNTRATTAADPNEIAILDTPVLAAGPVSVSDFL